MIIRKTEKVYNKMGQPYLASLYRALFTAAFYGLLRVGELTSGDHPIFATDVHMATNKRKVMFILYTSKTHWHDDKPQIVKIKNLGHLTKGKAVKGTTRCPYEIINKYAKARPTCRNTSEPFFVFKDRSPVKPIHMRNSLRLILKKLGFKSKLYLTHSFRIGMACLLFDLGVPIETIKKLGRWKSNSVYAYFR